MTSVHSGGSIRNDAQAKRKVFKNVLDSPFVMKWPAISNEVGQSVLTHLITLLEPIGTIRRENTKNKKKEKKQEQTSYPEIYKRLRTGNNTITELLEKIIQDKEQEHHHQWTIFVCKRDIQPTQLCNHLLPMCTMAKAKLVPLPEGSVVKIGQALNIPRVSVLALQLKEDNGDNNNKEEERLRLAVEEVPYLVQTQWLDDATASKGTYQPTNVKVIQTTAPIKQPKKQQPQQQQQQQQQQKQQKRPQDQSNNNNNNQPNKKIKR